jgi:hypothetical protein
MNANLQCQYEIGKKCTLFLAIKKQWMRKCVFILLTVLGTSIAHAQNVNVVATHATTSGTYPTLKAAFDAVNAGTHMGAIAITIVNNTTETATAQLNSYSGPALFTTLSIQPVGGRTITGNLDAPLIDFNSSDYVTVDGLNTGGNSLTISNTNTGATAATFRFRDDATNNIVRNCNIYGSSTSVSTGTIVFSTGTVVGNDYNTINNNNIGDAGNNLPCVGIYSTPNAAASSNDNVTVHANNIYNFNTPSGKTSGIFLDALNVGTFIGSNSWTITNNKFYQTGVRDNAIAAVSVQVIRIGVFVSGSGFTISGNIIGFGASNGTGVSNYGTSDCLQSYDFKGILVNLGSNLLSSIQDNTIAGISINSSGTIDVIGVFSGITISNGYVNIGNVLGNKIGLLANGISVTTLGVNNTSTGIWSSQSNATAAISNNSIINFTVTSLTSSAGTRIFNGIRVIGGSAYTISNNTIGRAIQATNYVVYPVYGKLEVSALSSIQGNTIEGLNITNNSPSTTTTFSGIHIISGLVNIGNITPNNIGTLTNSINISTAASTSNNYGIYSVQVSGSPIINNNVIQNCTLVSSTAASATTKFTGIYFSGAAGYTVRGNVIGRSITCTEYLCYGMEANVGSAIVTNIENNVIAGVSVSSSYSGNTALFSGIHVRAGLVNIGSSSTSGNQIGTSSNSIFVTTSGIISNSYGIYSDQSTSSSVTINHNTIRNCTFSSSVVNNATAKFSAIHIAGTSSYSVNTNNIIAAINTTEYSFYGIEANVGTTVTSAINGNTIAGVTMISSYNGTTPLFAGIYVRAGIVNIGNTTGNNIGTSANSIFLTTTGATSLSYGIYTNQAVVAPTVNSNIIQNILLQSNVVASTTIKFTGIYFTGGSGNFVNTNTIGNRINATNYVVKGIEFNMSGTIPNSVQGNTIAGIDITTNLSGTVGTEASPFVGIDVVNGNANIGSTTGNRIGTSAEYIRVTSTGNRTHNYGIKTGITVGSVSINNNTMENIRMTSTTSATADWMNVFTGIFTNNTGAYNIDGNIIGSLTTANSIQLGVSNTTIPYVFKGIVCEGAFGVTVSRNTICNITNETNFDGVGASMATIGILINAPFGSHNVNNNLIHTLKAPTTLSANVNVGAIVTGSTAAGGNLHSNRVYGLINTATGTTNSIAGFVPNGGNWTVYNNMISLSNSTNNNGVICTGICDLGAAGARNYYFNSIHIEGASAATHSSVAFQFDRITGTVNSRNNIFDMRRSGGGKNYAIVNTPGNFSGYVSDYNVINAPAAPAVCFATTDKTFSAWKTTSTNDTRSIYDEPIPFADQSIADLHIVGAPCKLIGQGIALTVLRDFDADVRKTGVRPFGPEMGADEISKNITWTGTTNSNWNNSNNWGGAPVPNSVLDNVVIPNVANKPVINTGETFQISSITIASGSSLINNGTLKVYGTVTATNSLNTQNGTIDLNSACNPQTIAGANFTNKAIRNLIIGNSTTTSASVELSNVANDTLKITGNLNFGNVNNAVFKTNNNLTLISTAAGTANVLDATNGNVNFGNSIQGNAVVERFIPNTRKWRLLSWPTISTQTAKQSLMENAATPNGNPNPGYGCIVTDEKTSWSANGFDSKSLSGPSVKYYDPATDKYIGIPNTTSFQMNSKSAYYNYVRGDRSALPNVYTGTSTVLRSVGLLKEGAISFTIQAGKFDAIGNPYASAIDIRKIDTANLTSTFYVWDPLLAGEYGLGAYQMLYKSGSDYRVLPGGGTYGVAGSIVDTLESGAGFFVRARASNGTLTFNETTKEIGKRAFTRGATADNGEAVFALLNSVSQGVPTLLDGTMAMFDHANMNEVDFEDALKLNNTGVNVSLKRSNNLLAIERRKSITSNDTLYLNLASLSVKKYLWDINITNMITQGRAAFLIDKFTNTITALDLNAHTNYEFDVTNTANSNAADRFIIVFKQEAVMQFVKIKATRNTAKNVKVEWEVTKEKNILTYTVEKSTDAINFVPFAVQIATANNGGDVAYSVNDATASNTKTWYKVKATGLHGTTIFSENVMVNEWSITEHGAISIHPTLIVNGMVNFYLTKQKTETLSIIITNSIGQIIATEKLKCIQGNGVHNIKLGQVAKGKYQAAIVHENGEKSSITFIVQ